MSVLFVAKEKRLQDNFSTNLYLLFSVIFRIAFAIESAESDNASNSTPNPRNSAIFAFRCWSPNKGIVMRGTPACEASETEFIPLKRNEFKEKLKA